MEYAPEYSPSSFTSILILHENNHATRVETLSTTRDGKVFSARLPSIKLRFESRCHMWIECNVGSRPCTQCFSSGFLQFSSLHNKPTLWTPIWFRGTNTTTSLWELFRVSRVNKNYSYIYFSETATWQRKVRNILYYSRFI